MGMLSWLFGKNKVVHEHLKPKMPEVKPTLKYDSMVGEPVISFLDSLEREPKRYKLEWALNESEYVGEVYYWMDEDGLCKITDTKVGTVWQAYVHGRDLYCVIGLPFDLNHWEMRAISMAFRSLRMPARERRERMLQSASDRAREAKRVRELTNRAAYAKQFQ